MPRCALALLALAVAAPAQDEEQPPEWKVLPHEPLKLKPMPDAKGRARAEALIEKLLELEERRNGLFGSECDGFDVREEGGAFSELIRLGPAAIPVLLEHLDDARETRLWFEHPGEIGYMTAQAELRVPPGRHAEKSAALKGLKSPKSLRTRWWTELSPESHDHAIARHGVTIGDCCFAILGQITNRPYDVVHYEPSVIVVISSPTRHSQLVSATRNIWGSADARTRVAESLLRDFFTRVESSDHADYLQSGAARRLLTYFPKEAGPLVAKRVGQLDFEETETWKKRRARNGVRADEFLRDVMATGHPLVRAEWRKMLAPDRSETAHLAALIAIDEVPEEDAPRVRAILDKTADTAVLLACLSTLRIRKDSRLFNRLVGLLRLAVEEEIKKKQFRESRDILEAMIELDEVRALPVLRSYIEMRGAMGLVNALRAVHRSRSSKMILEFCPPLLGERREIEFDRYMSKPSLLFQEEKRICDWAALLISRVRTDLAFEGWTPVEERDRAIAAMRKALTPSK